MTTQIRALKSDDRRALEAVLRSDATFDSDEIDVALELVDDALAKASSDYWFQIAEVKGAVAGYICFGPTPMTDSTYDLYWIVTHAAFRGQKIAQTLIRSMEGSLLKRGPKAQIRVETSQTEGYGAARKLYDRMGYPEVARFANFYKQGDDLIVFFKSIP